MRVRVALAIAALVAVPITAAADDPAPQLPAGGAPSQPPAAEPAPEQPAPAPAGDPAYGERPESDVKNFPAPRGQDVLITSRAERSKQNMYVLGGMAAAGVIAGAIGLYFHMDARSASDEVSANKFTGEPWSAEHQATYDRASSSGMTAGVLYGIGGGLLLATAIAFIATEPKEETILIHPHSEPKSTALVAPTHGGAIVGGAWRF